MHGLLRLVEGRDDLVEEWREVRKSCLGCWKWELEMEEGVK